MQGRGGQVPCSPVWLFEQGARKPAMRGGWALWKGGDGMLIDGLGPDGIASVTRGLSRQASRLQTGYVYHYAFAMLIGVAGLITWFMFGVGGQ